MTWLEFVKQYLSGHPNVKWSEALKRCKAPWAAEKKRQKHLPKYRGKPHIAGECYEEVKPCKLSKRVRDRIKEECGIEKIRTKPQKITAIPKKKRKKTAS